MKFLMILPPSPWLINDRDQPFLGALYVVGYLRFHGLNAQVCDLSGLPEEYWHIPYADVYGITGTTPHFIYMKKIISMLKERDKSCIVIAGGVHASVLPEHVIENTDTDICIVGEGEEILYELLTSGQSITTRKIIQGTQMNLCDNDCVYPARDEIDYYDYLKPDTYKYLAGQGRQREASIITGRGCPYKCAFCASNKLYCGRVRFRDPQDVYHELKELKKKYAVTMCNFVDDIFMLDEKRLKDICSLIKLLNIKWHCLTRVDKADHGLFAIMHDAGCVGVTFGFESGSNRMLELMGKNTTALQGYYAAKVAKKSGLKVRGQLMVGFPGETDEDIELTGEFIRKSEAVNTFGLHVFQPYPGTDVWEHPEKYGITIDKNTDFNNYHTIGNPMVISTDDIKVKERYLKLERDIGERNIAKINN